MGVREPCEEAFTEVPATPPGVRDLDSDDDLFTEDVKKRSTNGFNNDFFKDIIPVIPCKGSFELLEVQDAKDIWNLQLPTTKKNDKYCIKCMEDVKKDLKKLEEFVQKCKNETSDLKAENESLKKELYELKKRINQNDNNGHGEVKVSIVNSNQNRVDVLVKDKSFNNTRSLFSDVELKKTSKNITNNYGIQSFSISLPKENINYIRSIDAEETETKNQKSITQLRKEFFEKKFESEQKVFKSQNFLEIKPEEKKEIFRSRLTIRVKPKPKIAEIISKLTSLSTGSKLIPEATPITLFQRFEKRRVIWQNDIEERFILQRN